MDIFGENASERLRDRAALDSQRRDVIQNDLQSLVRGSHLTASFIAASRIRGREEELNCRRRNRNKAGADEMA
jgi:hypothetical protein